MRIRYPPQDYEEEPTSSQTPMNISDTTAFHRMQTQFEQVPGLVDQDFVKKHRTRIVALDKFAPLAYTQDKKQKQIARVRSMKQDLLEEAGLYDEAERSALDDVRDYQVSRGSGGFYSKVQITQRHEIKETSDRGAKTRGWAQWFKKAPNASEETEED